MSFAIERKSKMDWLWIVVLAFLGLVSRIPFVSHILYHWDSINFALAINHYDIAHHQPQPPGYILYVLLARLVNVIVANPQWTMVGINILASILTAIILYQLGWMMFNRPIGIAAALWLLFCPLFWFYSEVAMPYIIDGLAVTSLAWLFYRAERGENISFLPAAILLGVSGGFRQQTMVFMVPLAIYAMRKASFKQMVLAGGTSFVVFLGSFIPMVWLSGGWQAYRQAVSGLTGSFFTQTSIFMGGGWKGLVHNVLTWGSSTAYALALIGIILLVWAIWKIRKFPALLRENRAWFLAMWILPSLVFYTFIHMGSHGLVFTFLPAVIMISAKALADLVEAARALWRTRIWVGAISVILMADVLLFAVISNKPLAGVNFKIVNWATIRANDRYFANRFDLIQNHFDPKQSVIFATDWRHVQYYLPQYQAVSVPCGSSEITLNLSQIVAAYARVYQPLQTGDLDASLSTPIQTVIFFDVNDECVLSSLPQERIQPLSVEGETVYMLQLEPGETLEFKDEKISIRVK